MRCRTGAAAPAGAAGRSGARVPRSWLSLGERTLPLGRQPLGMGARPLGAGLLSFVQRSARRARFTQIHWQIGDGRLNRNLAEHVRDETAVVSRVIDHM